MTQQKKKTKSNEVNLYTEDEIDDNYWQHERREIADQLTGFSKPGRLTDESFDLMEY